MLLWEELVQLHCIVVICKCSESLFIHVYTLDPCQNWFQWDHFHIMINNIIKMIMKWSIFDKEVVKLLFCKRDIIKLFLAVSHHWVVNYDFTNYTELRYWLSLILMFYHHDYTTQSNYSTYNIHTIYNGVHIVCKWYYVFQFCVRYMKMENACTK